MAFPKRIYTEAEVKKAQELIARGYKHRLTIKGGRSFTKRVRRSLELVKTAGYYDFLRIYIRSIEEIDGLTQLHEADAAIWANEYAVKNVVDAASLFIQKAHHMKAYIERTLYNGGIAEKQSVEKRIEFLEALRSKSEDKEITEECDRLLGLWRDSSLVY